jgi:hypothetical protein
MVVAMSSRLGRDGHYVGSLWLEKSEQEGDAHGILLTAALPLAKQQATDQLFFRRVYQGIVRSVVRK